MRFVVALLVGLLAGCAASVDAPSGDRGASIGADVMTAARSAGLADCATGGGGEPDDSPAAGVRATCLTTGKQVPVLPHDGLPAIVNFWASWCQDCRDELPLLARAARQYDGRIRFVGVLFADKAPLEALDLAKDSGVTYPQLADPDSATKAPFGLRGLPQTVFIDETGTIVGTAHTAFTNYDDLLAAIDEYLSGGP